VITIDRTAERDVVVVRILGLAMGPNLDLLLSEIIQQGKNKLLINFSSASRIDFFAPDALIKNSLAVVSSGGILALVETPSLIAESLILSDLDSNLPMFDSMADALQRF